MSSSRSSLLAGEVTQSPWTLSKWTLSERKRWFDLLCSVPLFVIALPLMLITALAVKVSSPGPVLFRQMRTGRRGAEFEIVKFRTMTHGSIGPGLTRRGDERMTRIGRIIRETKLDELPQLWNVVRGDMSLVGPRPDLPEYVAGLRSDQREVLQLRPGMTSPASLRFRNEQSLLAEVPREEMAVYYVSVLLPQKVCLELEYARKATMLSDVSTLFRTAAAIFKH